MNFIERISGVSPDGGDGSLELAILALLVLVAGVAAWRWLSRSSFDETSKP